MGRFAGAAGAGGSRLTRWAFAAEAVTAGIDAPVVLVLPPTAAFNDWTSAARSRRRRRVLAVLAERALAIPAAAVGLSSDGGPRRIVDTSFFASVAERDGWAAAAVARVPIGIDIEASVGAAAARSAVLEGVASVDVDRWHGLAGVWAAREAVLKAVTRDLTNDPGGWRFTGSSVAANGVPRHSIDLVALCGFVVAVAYVGG